MTRVVQPIIAALRAERQRQGLSQTALAERIGTSQPELCAWEKGRKATGLFLLLSWANALALAIRLRDIDGRSRRYSDPAEIVKVLTAMRRRRHITQRQLGASIGVCHDAVSKWERGASLPTLVNLTAWCEALNSTVSLEHVSAEVEAAE